MFKSKTAARLYDVVRQPSVVIINIQLLANTKCPSDVSFSLTWKIFVKINEAHGHALFFILCSIARGGKMPNNLLSMLSSIQGKS